MPGKNNSSQTDNAAVNLLNDSTGFFIDREKESRRLREAMFSRQSMMITGPDGIGKTALVSKVIAELPPAMRQRSVYVWSVKDMRDLLRQLIGALYEAGDAGLRRELHAAGISRSTIDGWLKNLSTSRLRGTLYRAVEGDDYRIFLDHFPPLTPAVARVIKELFWMRNTPVCLIPFGAVEMETRKAGHFFYWGDKEVLRLGPIPLNAARGLLEACIQKFDLTRLDLEGFREEVLELSQSVPGAIVKMCELAASPRYQFDSRIKTKLVHIDYLMRGCAGNFKAARMK